MPDLKTVLFEHAKDYREKWQNFMQLLGEKNDTTIRCQNKYYGCLLVIRDSGLEAEFEAWLKKQEEGSEKDAR